MPEKYYTAIKMGDVQCFMKYTRFKIVILKCVYANDKIFFNVIIWHLAIYVT